jgi:hypothetical protein
MATEFAMTIPLILLFALACADFGRVAHFDQVVANAARTGGETGATHSFTEFTRSNWEAGIREAVIAEMQNIPGFDQSQLAFELSTTKDADGLNRIVVVVSYPFRTEVAWPALPSEIVLHKRFEIRQFR